MRPLLAVAALVAAVACSRSPSAAPAAPKPEAPAATPAMKTPPVEVAAMPDALTHLPVKLETPYYPWQEAYDRVAADAELGSALPKMRAALEAAGPPEARLRAMAAAADAARGALAGAGRQADFNFNGLDPVELDLRVVFFDRLARAIAGAEAPVADKRAALAALRALVDAPPPVGVPAPDERRAFTATGRMTAATKVEVQIEALDAAGGE